MRILLLGGIGEALRLAQRLAVKHELTYSLAGRVRHQPELPCKVRIGGFGGVEGLTDFLRQGDFELVIDATHPYAAQISQHAVLAAGQAGIPLWAYRRPRWQPEVGDDWRWSRDWSALSTALTGFHRPFFTIGLEPLNHIQTHIQTLPSEQYWLVRCLEAQPAPVLRLTVLNATGPFSLEEELELLQCWRVDVLVSKNSGGSAVAAKLKAARLLKIPVLMLQRPELPAADAEFEAVEAIAAQLFNC
jgi:precorrin-6A/cobalt-precorrin-6A reductase